MMSDMRSYCSADYTITMHRLLTQSAMGVTIEFGSTMAINVGSALQAYWDIRLEYSHALALVAVLVLCRLQRASYSSSDNAECLSFINSEKHQQRPRAVSSDVDDESVLSDGDDDSKSAVFEEEDFQLERQVPEATSAERLRFLVAKRGHVGTAAKNLKAYLKWRTDHQHTEKDGEGDPTLLELEPCTETDTDDGDANDWNMAAAAACKARKETCLTALPRIARLHQVKGDDIRDLEGHRVLHIIPGQMDDRLVKLQTYATAVALYIDRKLAPESSERVSVVIDVRGGKGWRNLHASKLLPFIQTTTTLLLTMFPERLERAVVYPLPPAFGWIWSISKRCIDPLTANKICILTGPATIISPPPTPQMVEYMDESIVALLEQKRVAAFVTPSPEGSLQS
jgi:hypothetical protein